MFARDNIAYYLLRGYLYNIFMCFMFPSALSVFTDHEFYKTSVQVDRCVFSTNVYPGKNCKQLWR